MLMVLIVGTDEVVVSATSYGEKVGMEDVHICNPSMSLTLADAIDLRNSTTLNDDQASMRHPKATGINQ